MAMWVRCGASVAGCATGETISVDDHGARLPELKGITHGSRARGRAPVLPDRAREACGICAREGSAGAASAGR
jgi:hypothetical protein